MEKVYKYTITEDEVFENVFTDEKLLMNHVVVPAGKVFPKHPTDAIVYALIIRGELSLAIGDNPAKTYGVGNLVNIPKGVDSELGNKGDNPLELFVVKYEYDK
ncbi:MAG: cupin domain-containing protein [Anaerovoracaceae bacterium]